MTTTTSELSKHYVDRAAIELASLGEDPDRIADVLWLADARGPRNDEAGNPIARYLRRLLGLGTGILVNSHTGRVELPDGSGRAVLTLPASVREFLGRFNRGLYPNLEAW